LKSEKLPESEGHAEEPPEHRTEASTRRFGPSGQHLVEDPRALPARGARIAKRPQLNPAGRIVIVIAGPNGAGKTSAAPELLRDAVGILAFVNADVIAEGLSAFRPQEAAFEAGRISSRW